MKQEIKERIELINKGIVPAGYKKTSVGICPVEWIETILGKICEINPKTERLKSTFQYIDLESIVNGKVVAIKMINKQNAPSRAQRVLSKNDIIYQLVRPYQKNNFLLKNINENQIVASTGYAQLRCKNPEFIYNLINTDYFCNQVLEKCTGTNYPAITSGELYKILVNIPINDTEKQKIAEILDCATRQVELQEQLVDKLKVQKKALMQKLLTPQPDWQKLKLKNIINFYNGYAFKSETYVKNGAFYVITISNVKDGGFVLQEDTSTIEIIPTDIRDYQILRKGDILISMTGNVGRVCKVECDNCLLNQRVGKIEVKKEFDKDFIFYSLQSYNFVEKMKLLAQGAAQDNMSVKDINNYIIYLPKNKEIQSNISNLLSNIDKRIELQQKLLEQYKLRQKSLMQLLLTGIVRVC